MYMQNCSRTGRQEREWLGKGAWSQSAKGATANALGQRDRRGARRRLGRVLGHSRVHLRPTRTRSPSISRIFDQYFFVLSGL
jgi:hypothetical protein